MFKYEKNHIYVIHYNDRYIIDKLINWWTRSKFSHTGVLIGSCQFLEVIPNNTDGFFHQKWRLYNSIEINHNPNAEILVQDVDLKDNYSQTVSKYLKLVGKEYDWLAIIGFVLRWKKQENNKFFCSEGVISVLKNVYKWNLINPSFESPERASELLDVFCDAKNIYQGLLKDFQMEGARC